MYVTSCYNNAFLNFYFTAGTNELSTGRASNIATVADGSVQTYLASIC